MSLVYGLLFDHSSWSGSSPNSEQVTVKACLKISDTFHVSGIEGEKGIGMERAHSRYGNDAIVKRLSSLFLQEAYAGEMWPYYASQLFDSFYSVNALMPTAMVEHKLHTAIISRIWDLVRNPGPLPEIFGPRVALNMIIR